MPEKPFFLTTPIYYVNDTPHIGHFYTQAAADTRARFERLRGRKTYFLTGTDENATKVARAAIERGRDPQEYCDELAQKFRDVWDAMEISYDDYIRTTESRHVMVAQKVIEKLWNSGHLELGTYSGWYSVPDETFFRPEDTIERDGAHYIANPTEDQSTNPLEWVEEQTHFFKLSNFGDMLLKYYDENPQMLRPETRRNETLSFIRDGLRDISISRVQKWGIPLPESVPASENHVIYVWFEALMNYFSAPGYFNEDPARREFFDEVWPADLHLMSKDIFTRFHTTIWPALLSALDLPLPKEIFAHGFWTVNGRKMSKRDPETRIEPVAFAQAIADLAGTDFRTGADALRYYCLREVTFGADGDFSQTGCLTRYNSELANGLGNLVNRAISMLQQYFGGVVPDATSDLGLRQAAETAHATVGEAYSTMNFSGALAAVWEVIGLGNRIIEEQKPWAKFKAGETEAVAGLLRELLAVCQWSSVALAPVMPHISKRLSELLGIEGELKWQDGVRWECIPVGHRCAPPSPLFPRIKDVDFFEKRKVEANMEEQTTGNVAAPAAVVNTEALSEQTRAESNTSATAISATGSSSVDAVEEKTFIEYGDFSKVELRVGKVLEAERVPKADKLLRLIVDIGTEKRQILAGIAQQFEPEAMIGKTVIVVANLAPRKLRGFESQGMLLAASYPDDGPPLGLVTVDADVPAGSIIR